MESESSVLFVQCLSLILQLQAESRQPYQLSTIQPSKVVARRGELPFLINRHKFYVGVIQHDEGSEPFLHQCDDFLRKI